MSVASDRDLVLRSVPDTPFHVVARHFVAKGTGTLRVVRDPSGEMAAAVVIATWAPTEPMGFGPDPGALVRLLLSTPGWDCVNVAAPLAARVAEGIGSALGYPTRYLDDVHYVLDGPPERLPNSSVRLLGLDDHELLADAPLELRGEGADWPQTLLGEGIIAGAVVDGRLVARVNMEAHSERFAEIGAATAEPWRNRGFAAAGAALVAAESQRGGFTPVWSTGGHNLASQRVATKVGFREYGRWTYVIVPALQEQGGFRPS
ncbi:MAG TPA: GNAT family N-acetyltransferase [Thermoplasmata archaeon]|nr:GNAT family N-acetyltransferase [Thermoplasmata archaeon]